MNNSSSIVLKSSLVALLVVLSTFMMAQIFVALGMYRPHPGLFFSKMMGVSMFLGWAVYWLMSYLLSWGYYKYLRLSSIKSTCLNGLIWGVVFFIVTQFVIAIFRFIFESSKDESINDKTVSLIVLHLVIGLVTSYATKFLYQKKTS